MTKPINYVGDMDIEKFFDTADHKGLLEAVKQRISDRNFLRLIVRFLKAGVMEEGKYRETDKGTPQGQPYISQPLFTLHIGQMVSGEGQAPA